jgi:hypothetical protein
MQLEQHKIKQKQEKNKIKTIFLNVGFRQNNSERKTERTKEEMKESAFRILNITFINGILNYISTWLQSLVKK